MLAATIAAAAALTVLMLEPVAALGRVVVPTPPAVTVATGSNTQVTLTTGCNEWERGVDVVVEGKAVHVTDETVLNQVAQAFRVRWDGRWQFAARDGHFYDGDAEWPAEVFGVTPARAFSFAKGDPFGATTHRF